jgi:two-component system, chemotaxis family, chemotaxis protein CheY
MPLRVLVVDDSAAMRNFLRKVLSTSDLPVELIIDAADGVEALERLEENTVNLILSDINMPNMNGEEMVRMLRKEKKYEDVAIVMITTDSSAARVHRLRQLGTQGYISKPFTPDIIKDKVRAVMAHVLQ